MHKLIIISLASIAGVVGCSATVRQEPIPPPRPKTPSRLQFAPNAYVRVPESWRGQRFGGYVRLSARQHDFTIVVVRAEQAVAADAIAAAVSRAGLPWRIEQVAPDGKLVQAKFKALSGTLRAAVALRHAGHWYVMLAQGKRAAAREIGRKPVSIAEGITVRGVRIFQPLLQRARTKATRARIRNVESAVEMYRLEHNGQCPASIDDLVKAKILRVAPKDAWGGAFVVRCPGVRNKGAVDIVSKGSDRALGTADDIHNFER